VALLREKVNVLVHMLRCHDTENIIHVDNSVNPLRDMETVDLELLLADIESLEKLLSKKRSPMKTQLGEKLHKELTNGVPARDVELEPLEWPDFRELNLLTAKPILYVCNVSENDVQAGNHHTEAVSKFISQLRYPTPMIIVSAKIEDELNKLESDDLRKEMLKIYGLEDSGLSKIVKECRHLLGLDTFYTVGPSEARAWTFRRNSPAVKCAGVVHSDMEKAFIRVEVTSYADFVESGSEKECRTKGKIKIEGPTHTINDGDILLFRFGRNQ